MSLSPSSKRLAGYLFFTLGVLCVFAASGILAAHARVFSGKRDTAVMIGTQLPELKSSVALLQASVEAEQLFAEQALAAREEQADAYVLPKDSPVPRVVSAVQTIVLGLDEPRTVSLESIAFQSNPEDRGSVKEYHGTVVLKGSLPGVAATLAVLGLGGDMMVKDVISVPAQQEFLTEVQASTPLSLKSAEDFLYLDLVEYASAPDASETRLTTDASADTMLSLRTFLLEAGLASVRSALGQVAPELKSHELWPLPLLRIDALRREGSIWTVSITAFGR